MVKRVLIIAYNFPPVLGSSAVQRTLSFTKYLPRNGWEPLILSVQPFAYPMSADDQIHEIPDNIIVKRTFALDTVRHLGIKGKYPRFAALPDRWISWWLTAVPTGMYLIRKYKPLVIYTTYPIATAHLIGMTLQKYSKLPWIADFRDSMTDESFPSEKTRRTIYSWIENKTVTNCAKAVFTTASTKEMYQKRYQNLPKNKWEVIENGYNEENFINVEKKLNIKSNNVIHKQPIVLLHSGILYTSERDPTSFFLALKELKDENFINKSNLKIILRGTRNEKYCNELIKKLEIEDIVFVEPVIPYEQAIREMLCSSGLLIFQADNCNHQIPAKIYEYLRAKRPILALTDPGGDTARVLLKAGIDTIARLDSKTEIKNRFQLFINRIIDNEVQIASDSIIRQHNRESKTILLANLLNEIST